MTPEIEDDHVPAAATPVGKFGAAWFIFVDGLAVLGTVLIGILMIIICTDIVARNSMGASLPLVSEVGALLLVMIVCLQLPATIRADRLARTDVFFASFREKRPAAGVVLSALFNLTGAVVLAGIAWASLSIFEKDYVNDEFIGVTGIATLPTWPFRALILLGMTVAAAQFLVSGVTEIRTGLTGRGAR